MSPASCCWGRRAFTSRLSSNYAAEMDAAEGSAFTASMETPASFNATDGGVASSNGTAASTTETVGAVTSLSRSAGSFSATEGGVTVLEVGNVPPSITGVLGGVVGSSSVLESSISVWYWN